MTHRYTIIKRILIIVIVGLCAWGPYLVHAEQGLCQECNTTDKLCDSSLACGTAGVCVIKESATTTPSPAGSAADSTAGTNDAAPDLKPPPVDQTFSAFSSPAGISQFFNSFLITIRKFVASMVQVFLEKILTPILLQHVPINEVPAVFQSWQLLLNFVNMFFIVILIVMAFGTIFRTKYSYEQLLVPLIIVALLINFSFTIGENVVRFSDNVSIIFINQIKSDLVNGQLMTGLDLPDFLIGNGSKTIGGQQIQGDATQNGILTEITFIVFAVIALFAVTIVIIFAILRIPVLWLILILAPLAWIGYIIPDFRKETWTRWWNNLIGWSLFIPTYLFFLMFAFAFIKTKATLAPILGNGVSGAFFSTINNLLYYALTIMFLVGGLTASRKVSFKGAEGIKQLAGGIEGNLKKLPVFRFPSETFEGGKRLAKRIEQEGIPAIPGFTGEKGRKERIERKFGRTEKFLGFKPTYNGQKQFTQKGNDAYSELKDDLKYGRLRRNDIAAKAEAANPTDAKGYAMIKLAYDEGLLNDSIFENAMTKLASNPYALEELAKSGISAKFKDVNNSALLDYATNDSRRYSGSEHTAARKEIFKYLGSDRRRGADLNYDQLTLGVSILGGPSSKDGKEFLDNLAKVRPDLVIQYKQNHTKNGQDMAAAPAGSTAIDDRPTVDQFKDYLKGTGTISDVHINAWNIADFQEALAQKIGNLSSSKAMRNFLNNLAIDISNSESPRSADKENIINDNVFLNRINTVAQTRARNPLPATFDIRIAP